LNIKKIKTKNNLFFIMTILNIIITLITKSLSPFNFYGSDLAILSILSFAIIAISLIGLILGISLIKSHFKEILTVKSLILIGCIIIHILNLLRTIALISFLIL